MGCFGINGCISKLPILYGDKCFLMIGVSRKDESHDTPFLFGTGFFFTPIALPLFGDYDDYGRIENVRRDRNVEVIEDVLGDGINEIINAIDNSMAGRFSDDNVYEGFCLGALKKLGLDEDKYSLTFTIDHKFIYDSICQLNLEIQYDLNGSLELTRDLPCTFADYIKDTELQSRFKTLGQATVFDIPMLFDAMKNKYVKSKYGDNGGDLSWIKRGLDNLNPNFMDGLYSYNEYYDSYALMRAYRESNASILLNELGDEYVNFLSFFLKMKQLDWNILVHNYSGQEGYNNIVSLRDFYKGVLSFIDEKIKEEES